MSERDKQEPVVCEEVFNLLYPGLAQREENQLVARFCTMCAARLGEELPVERIDTGLWCAQCLGGIEAGPYRRKPGFLYGEDEEWYIFYRFCPQCGVELPPRPLRWGATSGSKVFCRGCYTEKPTWLAAQQEMQVARSRMIFDQFWNDCRHGHLHTMALWQGVYGLRLYPKVFHTDSGAPYTVTALVLPPKTILGLFLPVRDRPDAPYHLGWWSPYEQGRGESRQG